MEITASIASVALNTDFKKLPREVVDMVKHVVLDSVGCALGGTVTDRARIALGNEVFQRGCHTLGGQEKTRSPLTSCAISS